ncbi:MAG: exo-alpha-sialidase [Spirochaetes bacterium]|nr:exo-alpha-sialidase [Spirochaetota bacterium]
MNRLILILLNLRFRYPLARRYWWYFLLLCITVTAVLFVFRPEDVITQTIGWEKNFSISSFTMKSKNVAMTARGNFIASVYEGIEEGIRGIYVSVSFNGGASFLPSRKVADVVSKIDCNPHLAVSGNGEVAVTWHVFKEEEFTNRVYCAVSRDYGANWDEPKQIALGLDLEMLPHVYFDEAGKLHLFFQGNRGQSFNLYHAYRNEAGTFEVTGPIIELEQSLLGAFFPSIHFSGDGIYIVWQGRSGSYTDNLFFIRSFNSGRSWSGRQQITRSEGSNIAPSVLFHQDALYVAYQNNDSKNWGIKLVKGISRGELWSTYPRQISQTNVNCYAPVAVSSGSDIMVLWYDAREGKDNIYANKYMVKDDKLAEEARLSVRNIEAKRPVAVSVGSKVVSLWEEGGVIMGKYSDVHVAPPEVFSPTHPEGVWTKNPVALIKWKSPKDESGVVAYWTLVTTKPDIRPFVDPPIADTAGNVTQKVIANLEDGVTYFHIRAEDGAGNLSRTVHYKLQVSIRPLPSPVVISPTHPQGKAMKSNAPVFRWALDDSDRLKGFYYTLSKDYFTRPDTFTTDFETSFNELEEGRYFFRIQAVDKTNKIGPSAMYDIVVGKAEPIDPDLLKKIAEEKEIIPEWKEERIVIPRFIAPAAWIEFPFNVRAPYERSSFQGIIVTRGIPKNEIVGYSVFVNRERMPFPAGITTKSSILSVSDLTDGQYYVGVKCKYYGTVQGRRQVRWTEGRVSRIQVRLREEAFPLERILTEMARRANEYTAVISLFFLLLCLSIAAIGYGRRLSFLAALWRYRIRKLIERFSTEGEEL